MSKTTSGAMKQAQHTVALFSPAWLELPRKIDVARAKGWVTRPAGEKALYFHDQEDLDAFNAAEEKARKACPTTS